MSCSLKGCGFGRVQKKKDNLNIESLKSRKSRKIRKSRKRKSVKKSSRRIKRRSRRRSRRISKMFSPRSSPKYPQKFKIGDYVFCPKHKKNAKINDKYTESLNGGTLVLSCGCKYGQISLREQNRSHRFGFKYLRNDQIINSVFHNYPANLTCDRA
jgi:hypothetical protein